MLKHIRQITIPEIGVEGQKKIQNAKILVVGAGGLGTPAAMYLAASGVGTLGILDFDVIEESNLGRQVLYSQKDIGQKKVNVASSFLSSFHPDVNIIPYDIKLNKNNAQIIMQDYEIVVNGSDNFKTRYVVNEAAVDLNIPWIDAAVTGLNGQITSFIPGLGCYSCLFPDLIDNGNNCATEGILSPLCGMFGSWLAIEAIKIVLNLNNFNSNASSDFKTLYRYDIRTGDLKTLKWKKRKGCTVCGSGSSPSVAISSCSLTAAKPRADIPLHDASHTLFINLSSSDTSAFKNPSPNRIYAQINDFFSSSLEEPPFIKNIVENYSHIKYFIFYCEGGLKSKIAAKILQEEGYQAYVANK